MDAQPILDVLPMVEELRDTFAQSEKIVRMQQGARSSFQGGLAVNG